MIFEDVDGRTDGLPFYSAKLSDRALMWIAELFVASTPQKVAINGHGGRADLRGYTEIIKFVLGDIEAEAAPVRDFEL
jgi:hypothetical protein